ncbi:Mhf2p TDEL_0C02060 [Torulaspora delbrueckii]|uniref:Centromere protein X n=1 Tax=Torulaspora delbrueckii TaxID=4950 RepID=G8ZRF3_TORDE|nr:hypothetical protein TDEL_0C02060 [Torulaspora delbrueckii]CCE91095.1 hypothetical protein TDEL_0C02060 [Torulaspora delbrueckii]
MVDKIPKETIARTFQVGAFENESTNITDETVGMMQKYMEVFVREAVLRSSANKEQIKVEHSGAQRNSNEIVLTHEDLENITGLLLLDM